jgi:hypothetical protein
MKKINLFYSKRHSKTITLTQFLKDNSFLFTGEIRNIRNDEAKTSLKALMRVLKMKDESVVISKELDCWRNHFRTRVFSYPGDAVYYEMLCRSMKKGLSFRDAIWEVDGIIRREMKNLDHCHHLGLSYSLNFY